MTDLRPSAHTGQLCARMPCPRAEQWPDLVLDGFDYPDRLNAAVELTDAMVGARVWRPYRACGQWAAAHLQGTDRLDQPFGACAGRGSGHKAPATVC